MSSDAMSSPETLPPIMFFPPDALMAAVDEVFQDEIAPIRNTTLRQLGGVALKMVPDCNFRCDGEGYECYEYSNDAWEMQPERMSPETIAAVGVQIGEYTKRHLLKEFSVIFHGGEPLFTKDAAAYYDEAIDLLEESIRSTGSEVMLNYRMQTNASLITEKFLQVAKRRNIMIKCSIDGYEAAHDANRKTKQHSLGTFKMVDRGIRKLSDPESEYRDQFEGLLAVIDVRNDPIKTYEALCAYDAKEIDLLLPYANWDNPPVVPDGNTSPTPYADWLLEIFHRWRADLQEDKAVPDIRLFWSIINLSRGSASLTESIGPATSRVAFVRADGSFEGLDALNAISSSVNTTNMNVYEHNLDQVAQHLQKNHQLGEKELPQVCHDCKLMDICGGGHIETRYSSANEFNNPSVFSEDLKALVKEIVSVSNQAFLEEIAIDKIQALRGQYGTTPLKNYPSHTPLVTPVKRSLATRIRPATLEDVMDITDLHGAAFYSNYAGIVPGDTLQSYIADELLSSKYDYWTRQIDLARTTGNRIFVATLGKRLLGFAALNTTDSPTKMYLNAHYESPQTEGYGVGEALVEQVERTLNTPADIIVQSIKTSQQAAFLRRRGFMPASVSGAAQPAVIRGHILPPEPLIRRANNKSGRLLST
jgi:uncharacterized protein